ncbi:hypothetical protein [Streptomyces mirabilis]|uniref:hypothetical protein n=1 Tax=Streptomyces mirabilis TaxID=68239 RepID=UPI0033B9F711
MGRFLSPDLLLDTAAPLSWNAYGYADDTSVTGSDPTGACADVDCPTRNFPSCLNRTLTASHTACSAWQRTSSASPTPTTASPRATSWAASTPP